MTPKATSHVIQGMQKDTSKSKLSKEFAFDAKNIRITAREDNTLLTITNERGTQKNNDIIGVYIGHCILQDTLVLFTKYTDSETGEVSDYIIGINPNILLPKTLYKGDLNLSLDHHIEALGVYENEDIQKVYWVDGINQPRVINIKKSYMEGNKFKDASSFANLVIFSCRYSFSLVVLNLVSSAEDFSSSIFTSITLSSPRKLYNLSNNFLTSFVNVFIFYTPFILHIIITELFSNVNLKTLKEPIL